jgi:membrane protein insertase Oxa1/YidC/SpoIIIJ
MNLDWSAHEVQKQLPGEFLRWTPYFLIIAAVILTGWYQVKQTQARQLRQGGQAPNAQMQMITRVMPIFFGVITYGLNAATTIYFVVSNTWRIGQQHFVLNKMYEEEHQKKMSKSKDDDAPPSDAPEDEPADSNGSAKTPKPTPPKPKPIAGAGGKAKGPAPQDRNGSANGGSSSDAPSSGARRKNRKKKR